MPGNSRGREIVAIVRTLEGQGWQVRKGSHGWIAYPPNGDPLVSIPTSPSDHRAVLNLRRLLRRRGASGL